jgi:hypothetical protein
LAEEIDTQTNGITKLWNPAFKHVGIAVCEHSLLGNMVVIDYAEDFVENEVTRQKVMQLRKLGGTHGGGHDNINYVVPPPSTPQGPPQ